MNPMQIQGFEKLPEAEKKKVREAMAKAWGQPEVQQARGRLMKANDEFRAAMRKALTSVDPEVVHILEKIKPPQPFDPRSLPKLPPPDDPEFVRAAVGRLMAELMAFSKPDMREQTRAMHEKVMQLPAVKEAADRLQQAPPGARMEALGKLREIYREAVSREIQQFRERKTPGDTVSTPSNPSSEN